VVLLSWHDSCSRAVLEATALGVPCLTTAYNGASEALANGAGLVVDRPSNRPAVAEAYGQLADAGRRAAMSAAGRKLADSLSMRRHAQELLAVYGEITR
jgi:UDP-glucose:(heptosyl)LPS alpha-1,3-glucosyltransferase